MKPLRVFATGFVLHFKSLSASPFMVTTAAIWPLVYATLAFLMFRATHHAPSLLYAALGAAVMGIWSTTATSAGGAIQQQRNWKVLEPVAGAVTAHPRACSDHRGDRRHRRLLDRDDASLGTVPLRRPAHVLPSRAVFVIAIPAAVLDRAASASCSHRRSSCTASARSRRHSSIPSG
jgi:hypothetical protein